MEFYALKSNESSLYLRRIPEPIENLDGILQFSGADQNGDDAKFLMEESNTNPEYVHIKCSSKGKYLKKAPEKGTPWILAAAEQRVEDTNQPTCTLFKREPAGKDDYNDKVRLVHVQSGLYVRPITEGKFGSCLGVVRQREVVIPIKMASLPSPNKMAPLPSPFLLKADTNNKYLRYQPDAESDLNEIVQFSEDNPNSRFIKFTTETPNNEDYADKNYVHIKCSYNDKYLRRVDQNRLLILAAATYRNETKDNWACTLFKVEPVGPPDNNNLITRCRLRHLQSDLITRPFIENRFELHLNTKIPDSGGVDIYSVFRG